MAAVFVSGQSLHVSLLHVQLSVYSSLEQQLQGALKEVQLQRQQLKDKEGEVRREGQWEVEFRGTRGRAVGGHERERSQRTTAVFWYYICHPAIPGAIPPDP